MKNKSFKIDNIINKAATGKLRLEWGTLIFESYYKYDKKGNLVESLPRLSEYLAAEFYPFTPRIDGFKIYIGEMFTGFIVEQDQAQDCFIERITNKPDSTVDGSPEAVKKALHGDFLKHWGVDYPGND